MTLSFHLTIHQIIFYINKNCLLFKYKFSIHFIKTSKNTFQFNTFVRAFLRKFYSTVVKIYQYKLEISTNNMYILECLINRSYLATILCLFVCLIQIWKFNYPLPTIQLS